MRAKITARALQGCLIALGLIATIGFAAYVSSLPALSSMRWDFLGSIIGAAGTIFAGWLAFSAVQEQNRLAEQAKLDAAQMRVEQEKEQELRTRQSASRELKAIRELESFLKRILKPFDEGKADPDVVNLIGIDKFEQTVGWAAPSIVGLPEEMRNLAQSAWWPLYGVGQSYSKWKETHPDPATRGRLDRHTFNSSIGEAVINVRDALAEVGKEILQRES